LRGFFATSGRLEKVLDNFTLERIIMMGLISFLFLGIILYLVFIAPLSQKIEDSIGVRTSLEQEMELLESEQVERSKTIPNGLELPDALSYLGECFRANSLIVEEILINQLSSENNGVFNQAAIKVSVMGERLMVLQAVTETLNLNRYPFLIQELDITDNRSVIHYKIFLTKTTSVL
jgi:hypothetical protein